MEKRNENSLNTARVYGLDVARCLAVSMVLVMHSIQEIFHVEVPYFWYVSPAGVELFFSLSGFLIGRILLDIFSSPAVSFHFVSNFWLRRWLRTLPLYFITLGIYFIIYNLFIYPVVFDYRYLFFLQNINTVPGFFGESWSLSIEEWSYFTVPIIIFSINAISFRVSHKERNGEISYLIAAVVLILTMITIRYFYTLPDIAVLNRMDAVAYGLVAAYVSTKIDRLRNSKAAFLTILGLAIWLIAAVIKLKPDVPGFIKQLYFPVCGIGTAVFVLGLYYYKFKNQLSIIVSLSTISYSIYLIHLTGVLHPLGYFTRGLSPGTLTIIWILSYPLIIFLSVLSYKYIEKTFLTYRPKDLRGSRFEDRSPVAIKEVM